MNKLLTIILLLLFCGSSWAQDEVLDQNEESFGRVFMAELGIGSFRAQGVFADNIPDSKFHIETSILAQIVPTKPFFGGIYFHGSPFSRFTGQVIRQTDFGQERWNATTKSNLFGMGIVSRFFTPFQPLGIQPYFDFNFGTKILYTLTNYTYEDNAETTTIYDHTDLVWGYGVGFGLNYPLKNNLYLKSKISYTAGLSGRYYIKQYDSIDAYSESTLDAFILKQSATDALKWDLGVTFAF